MKKRSMTVLVCLLACTVGLFALSYRPAPCPLCSAQLSEGDWLLFDSLSGALLPMYMLMGEPGTCWFDDTNHAMQERLENGTALARFPISSAPAVCCPCHRPPSGSQRFQLLLPTADGCLYRDLVQDAPVQVCVEGQVLLVTLRGRGDQPGCCTVEIVPA